MRNHSQNILFFLGAAYVGLAIASLTTDIPVRTVNCWAFGAVLFSIAELIQSFTDRKKPLLNAKDFTDGKNLVKISGEHLINVLESRTIGGRKSIFFYVVLLIYSFAFTCIIVWPYTKGFEFLNGEKCGIFCTIVSLGIIMLSRYFSESFSEVEMDKELLDGMGLYFDSINNSVGPAIDSLEKSVSSLEKSIDSKNKEVNGEKTLPKREHKEKNKNHRQKNKKH